MVDAGVCAFPRHVLRALAGPHCTRRRSPLTTQNPRSRRIFHADHLGRASAPTVSSASTEPPAVEPRRPSRAHDNTWSRRRTRTTRTPGGGSALPVQNTVSMLAAAAAASRSANPGGGRTAPVRLTSPANAERGGGGTPLADEARAAATARSAPGSSIRSPPAAAPYSS